MVERVARTLVAEIEDQTFGSHSPRPEHDPEFWRNARDLARAAIAAMREPTAAMVFALLHDRFLDASIQHNRDVVVMDWQLMIDAALGNAAKPACRPVSE